MLKLINYLLYTLLIIAVGILIASILIVVVL